MKYFEKEDLNKYEILMDENHELNIALQLGVSLVDSNIDAKRTFLTNELQIAIKKLVSSSGLQTALTRSIGPRKNFSSVLFFHDFKRLFIETSELIPITLFSVDIFGNPKTIAYPKILNHLLQIKPETTLESYVLLSEIEFFEFDLNYLHISSILSYLNGHMDQFIDKSTKYEDLFVEKSNWGIIKSVLKRKKYIDRDGKWDHIHDNTSDLAILNRLLKDSKLINVDNLTPAGRLLYKEFGFEVGTGKYISEKMLTYVHSSKNDDLIEFQEILEELFNP